MNNYITLFIGLAIIIGLGTVIISASYNAIELPSGTTTTTEIVEGVSPPLPNTISNNILWLDADNGTSIAIGTGVAQWDDQSGQGNHVVQATGTKQPTVVSNDINGKDAIAFDGIDDVLQVATLSGGSFARPGTVAVVLRAEPAGTQANYFDGVSTSERWSLYQLATTGVIGFYDGSSSTHAVADSVNYHYYFLEHDAVIGQDLYIDNVRVKDGSSGVFPIAGFQLAAKWDDSSHAEIEVAELFLYDRLLNATEKNNLVDHIEWKYDLGMTLTGNYTEASEITTGTNSTATGWGDVQTNLGTQSQSATLLITIVLIALAAVIILLVVRRLN